jgi:hypothetical protein
MLCPEGNEGSLEIDQQAATRRNGSAAVRLERLKDEGKGRLVADLRSIDLPSVLLRMPLAAFGSKRPGHPPRVKADHKHDVDRHAKDNVKHRHEQYGFLQY